MHTQDRVSELKQEQKEDILSHFINFYDAYLKDMENQECRALKSTIEGAINRFEKVNRKMEEMKKGDIK